MGTWDYFEDSPLTYVCLKSKKCLNKKASHSKNICL